jgi:hypothetical protein
LRPTAAPDMTSRRKTNSLYAAWTTLSHISGVYTAPLPTDQKIDCSGIEPGTRYQKPVGGLLQSKLNACIYSVAPSKFFDDLMRPACIFSRERGKAIPVTDRYESSCYGNGSSKAAGPLLPISWGVLNSECETV